MDIEVRDDGTEVHSYRPLRGVPFYSHWLQFLLDHGAAHRQRVECACGSDPDCIRCDGEGWRYSIVPFTADQEQASVLHQDGTIGIVCICCGQQARRMEMNRIRIGGYVQFRDESPLADKIVESKWRRKPISKMGLGCKTCQILYAAVEQRAEQENKIRRRQADLDAQFTVVNQQIANVKASMQQAPIVAFGKCKHGIDERFCAICMKFKPASQRLATSETVKLPNLVTPWIDIFESMEGK